MMVSKIRLKAIDAIFSKSCEELKDGNPFKNICYLFFKDGYSPLLLNQPTKTYLELANGVISSLAPESYAYVCMNDEFNGKELKHINCISLIAVDRDGKNWMLRRSFRLVEGTVVFEGEAIRPLSMDMNITGRVVELYNALTLSTDLEVKKKAMVSRIAKYVQLAKIPYSLAVKEPQQ